MPPLSALARFERRFVPPAAPEALAFIRIVTFGILLISLLWEDLPSTAHLPRGMLTIQVGKMGIIEVLQGVPGVERLLVSVPGLAALEIVVLVCLTLALVGYRTRLFVPLGALGYLIAAGMIRQYFWFYHTGLVPTYVGLVLAFTRCGDVWSVDRLLRARRGKSVAEPGIESQALGWQRWAVWAVVALPYTAAGLSKLRNGGLDWLHPNTLKRHVFRTALEPMQFDFETAFFLADAPNWFWAGLAVFAVGGEIAMVLTLFSGGARRILPLLMVGMHIGILFLQRILFFDLILLQLVFLDVTKWRRRLMAREADPQSDRRYAGVGARLAPSRLLAIGVCLTLAATWILRVEWYPLTAMQMFSSSHKRGDVRYYKLFEQTASGDTRVARPETAIGALADSRYRAVIRWDRPKGRKLTVEFLRATAELENRNREPEDRIVAYELRKYRWYFAKHPNDPNRGKITRRFSVPIQEAL